jgi:N-acetylglucosaminyldiphosphoundecaprenol N-acetyl-beta-D-mannosaminyltransferase
MKEKNTMRTDKFFNTADFLGIKISLLDRGGVTDKILEFALAGRNKFITYLNAHCVNTYFSDSDYKEVLQKADFVYAGGQGVVWALRFLGVNLPERVNILDFFDRLSEKLKEKKTAIYLLGGKPEAVKKAGNDLKKKGLNVVGARHGFFDEQEEACIIREINELKPDILMVGMGIPKQEKWISDHLDQLQVNLCWAVGGVFRIFSGELKSAPGWISDCGLEWLYLGFQDFKRLFGRYLLGNFIFVFNVLRCKFRKTV